MPVRPLPEQWHLRGRRRRVLLRVPEGVLRSGIYHYKTRTDCSRTYGKTDDTKITHCSPRGRRRATTTYHCMSAFVLKKIDTKTLRELAVFANIKYHFPHPVAKYFRLHVVSTSAARPRNRMHLLNHQSRLNTSTTVSETGLRCALLFFSD